jgi:hypothetical protein
VIGRRAALAAPLVLAAALTVTSCSASDPYQRNAADAAACRAYATAVVQGTPLANIDAISAAAYAESGEIDSLIITSFQRYGSEVAPVDWCNAHGYPEHPLGLGAP